MRLNMFATLFLLLPVVFAGPLPSNPAIHILLHRRGGRFSHHESANLTKLLNVLESVENGYSLTYRTLEKNQLVRRWASDEEDSAMLEKTGLDGKWYMTVDVGDPQQSLEIDLDLLSPDFYTVLTTSQGGSKFNTFESQSHVLGDSFVHPLCRLSSDQFQLPTRAAPIHLDWPICQPSKSSRHTLFRSGTILGLAPNPLSHASSLSRLTTPSFLHQLHRKGIIQAPIWSITLLDSETGVLSLGGTLAAEFEEAKIRTEVGLKYIGQKVVRQEMEDEIKAKMAFAMPADSTFEDHFRWVDVSGASGWWTGLIGGVWVDGVKVLKNQPFLIDPTCPFILAPPTAFTRLYGAISGAKPLSSYSSPNTSATRHHHKDQHHPLNRSQTQTQTQTQTFHLFPCLNPPSISLELGGWPFPLTAPFHTTRSDAIHGPAGGLFSLGKIEEVTHATAGDDTHVSARNSGFCVGIVMKSDMGERTERRWERSGMRDMWVLGEPFLRGTGVVFDDGGGRRGGGDGKARMGFRSY